MTNRIFSQHQIMPLLWNRARSSVPGDARDGKTYSISQIKLFFGYPMSPFLHFWSLGPLFSMRNAWKMETTKCTHWMATPAGQFVPLGQYYHYWVVIWAMGLDLWLLRAEISWIGNARTGPYKLSMRVPVIYRLVCFNACILVDFPLKGIRLTRNIH